MKWIGISAMALNSVAVMAHIALMAMGTGGSVLGLAMGIVGVIIGTGIYAFESGKA